jgi:starch phosphorylase
MAISNYYLIPSLPEGLKGLEEIGLDLHWSWSHAADALWERIDPQLWNLTRNPWLILQSVPFSRLESLEQDSAFKRQLDEQVKEHHRYLKRSSWFAKKHADSAMTVAYFSMEFGLSESLPIYSGGLGILAGDHLKTASDLGVPVVGIGLLYQQGYFRQVIDAAGVQNEFYPYNDPSQLPILPVRDSDGEWLCVEVTLPGRAVRLRAWEARVGRVRLYLLDSNDPSNSPADRCITTELYGGGPELRLQQEIVLGIGGWQLLRAIGIKADVCHLNEGHAALAVIERARSFMQDSGQPFDVALAATRAGNVFTTHTPVEAGFDRFSPSLVWQYLQNYVTQLGIGFDDFMSLGRKNAGDSSEPLNMAYVAVRGSCAVNGVSRLHGCVSRRIFQPLFSHWPQSEVPVSHITNGVHVPSWDSAAADELWHNACGKERWLGTMATIESDLKCVPDETLWTLRNDRCRQLVQYVQERLTRQLEAGGISREEAMKTAKTLDPNILTIGFARRFAAYKRPNLLLSDVERLTHILQNKSWPVQLIIAGKAHPRDSVGKDLIHAWLDFIRRPEIRPHAVFIADYDMSLAEHLVHGVDLWLNTPRRPWEASGTSGMKVLVNGGLNLSELDGWWAEAFRPEVGWALGDGKEHDSDPNWDAQEAQQLYNILEQEVIPEFYNRDTNGIPKAWVNRMRLSMAELTPRFSTNRMMREYVEKLYLSAASAFHDRIANGARKAESLSHWHRDIQANWHNLRFGNLEVQTEDGQYTFKVPVYSGGLAPQTVGVQLYADSTDGTCPEIHQMTRGDEISNPDKGFFYNVTIPVKRKADDYTPRVVSAFDGACVPIEEGEILWYR